MRQTESAVIYTPFEIQMGRIFFRLYGGSTRALHEQDYWQQIEGLRELAIAGNDAELRAENERLRRNMQTHDEMAAKVLADKNREIDRLLAENEELKAYKDDNELFIEMYQYPIMPNEEFDELLEKTKAVGCHPVWYDYPCKCQTCMSYAD